MELLVNQLKDFCTTHGVEKTYWVGYSGGLDSHVLLHALTQLRLTFPLKIKAIHVHHGLSPNADDWTTHCKSICQALKIDLEIQKINLSDRTNLEEQARERRYEVFENLLGSQDILLTAHHQDDQAETVLLQLLRGAGPKGLASMPHFKKFGKAWHARPLLNFTREQLENYACQQQLNWIDDESNKHTDLTRNFLRHEVLSLLKKRWPSVNATLARVAENCAEAQLILDDQAQLELARVAGSVENTLSVKKLLALNPSKQRLLLRAWIQKENFPLPSAVKLQQLQRDMLLAREDKTPHFFWKNAELRRYRDDLFIQPILPEHDNKQILSWDLQGSLTLPNLGVLNSTVTQGQGLRADIKNVSVRFRQGGEMIQLPGRSSRHCLKKLFQQWNVLPWERNRIPLLYVEDQLAMVVGFCVARKFMASRDETGWLIKVC
jgi:tRNA(Ile)-lysidine synthase